MRQYFRPYSKVVSIADVADATPVTLTDTAGSSLACNYISLTLSGDSGGVGHVRMSADFPDLTTPQANFSTPTAAVGVASGVPSVYTTPGGEAATMVLSDGDRVSSVSIQGNESSPVIAILTYGQVSTGNNLRDQIRPRGN